MTTDNELRGLAEAATPGPWRSIPCTNIKGEHIYCMILGPDLPDALQRAAESDGADAAFIAAANPAAVLALLDRLDAAKAQRREAVELLREGIAASTRPVELPGWDTWYARAATALGDQ